MIELVNSAKKIYQDISELSDRKFIPFTIHRFADCMNEIANILYHQELLYDYGLFFGWPKDKDKKHFLELKFCCFNPKVMFD